MVVRLTVSSLFLLIRACCENMCLINRKNNNINSSLIYNIMSFAYQICFSLCQDIRSIYSTQTKQSYVLRKLCKSFIYSISKCSQLHVGQEVSFGFLLAQNNIHQKHQFTFNNKMFNLIRKPKVGNVLMTGLRVMNNPSVAAFCTTEPPKRVEKSKF